MEMLLDSLNEEVVHGQRRGLDLSTLQVTSPADDDDVMMMS